MDGEPRGPGGSVAWVAVQTAALAGVVVAGLAFLLMLVDSAGPDASEASVLETTPDASATSAWPVIPPPGLGTPPWDENNGWLSEFDLDRAGGLPSLP